MGAVSSFPSGLSKFWSLWSPQNLFSHKWQSPHLGRPSTAIDSGSWREAEGSRMLSIPFPMSLVLGILCTESSAPAKTDQMFIPMLRKVVRLFQYSQGNRLLKEGKTSCSSPQGWRIQVYHLWPRTVVDFYKLDQFKKYLKKFLHPSSSSSSTMFPFAKSHWIISLEWPQSLIKNHVQHLHP